MILRKQLVRLAALALITTLIPISAARAGVIILPSTFAGVEAGNNDDLPLGSGANSPGSTSQRGQQVYGSSLLAGLHPGDKITGLTFRLDGPSTSAVPAQIVPNYEIRLSRSVNAPGSLSSVFANNRGPDDVVVRSGPLVINPGDFPAGSSPNAFGVIIPFTTPYTYTGGPLLLELAFDVFPAGGRLVDADYPSGLDAQTIFATSFTATTAATSFREAIVVEFQVAAVPEPATVSVFAVGTVSLLGGLWVRKRAAGMTSSAPR